MDIIDRELSQMLGTELPKEEEPIKEDISSSSSYSLPVRVGKNLDPISQENKPWIVGTFAPDQYLNPSHPHGHKGVDLKAPIGTPIYSIGPGEVSKAGTYPKSGNFVQINHENGKVTSFYGHMKQYSVQVGQQVDSNTVIGLVGTSGNAKGTGGNFQGVSLGHVHWEVKVNGSNVDPLSILDRKQKTAQQKKQQLRVIALKRKLNEIKNGNLSALAREECLRPINEGRKR